MFVQNFRRCPLPLKLMSFVLNVCKCCTLRPLWQTQLNLIMCKAHEGSIVFSPPHLSFPPFNALIIESDPANKVNYHFIRSDFFQNLTQISSRHGRCTQLLHYHHGY
ncbi:hypothetical protein Hanom_Chr02g00158511 [Helianthus anomalus]